MSSTVCRVSCDERAHDQAATRAEDIFNETIGERARLVTEFLDTFPASEAFDYFDPHEHPWRLIDEVFAHLKVGNLENARIKAEEFMNSAAERHALSEMGLGY